MIDRYLKTTAESLIEIVKSDEEISLVSVLYNPKSTKYPYELRTILFYEIKDYSLNNVNTNFDVEEFINQCNTEYFKGAKETCSTAFEFIVNCAKDTELKIVCNIPEID